MSNARTHRPAAAQLEAAAEPSSSAGARGGMSDWPSPGAPGVQFQRDLALASPRAVQLDECEDLHEQKQEYDTRIGQIWNDHEAVIIEYEELNDLVDGLDDRSVQHGDRIRSLRDQLKSKEGALECSTEDLPGRLAAILAEVEVLWADYMKADDRYGVLGNRCSDLWTRLQAIDSSELLDWIEQLRMEGKHLESDELFTVWEELLDNYDSNKASVDAVLTKLELQEQVLVGFETRYETLMDEAEALEAAIQRYGTCDGTISRLQRDLEAADEAILKDAVQRSTLVTRITELEEDPVVYEYYRLGEKLDGVKKLFAQKDCLVLEEPDTEAWDEEEGPESDTGDYEDDRDYEDDEEYSDTGLDYEDDEEYSDTGY